MSQQDRAEDESARSRDWQRRRYLADVFGELLPESTSDDRAPKRAEGSGSDGWHVRNRPPHHDAG